MLVTSETWAARLAPEPFRDFLPYASPAALKVIQPGKVLGRVLEVAQHVSRPAERARQAVRLQSSLETVGLDHEIQVVAEPGPHLAAADLSDRERSLIGERVLSLYFHQLYWDGPLFLDLRPRHFSWNAEREQLGFYPSSLWCRPDPEFMRRLRSLYVGFYEGDAGQLAEGLELYRWEVDPRPGFSARMQLLLQNHFGPSSGQLRFAMAHFRATFDAIFKEAAQSRARLHPDLTFLGVELVGLYLTLESLGVPLDPRAAFAGARGRASDPGPDG